MLLARHWKRPFHLNTCGRDANRSSFTIANKYLFVDLLLFAGKEGDEATSPYFATENSGIDASSTLLEALIATYSMQWVCKQEQFTHGRQILVCQSLTFY